MLLLAVLFAGLGFSAPAQAQTATVTWDSAFVMAYGGPGGFLSNGDSVDIGTTVTFDFAFPSGWTYASRPSGCNIVHDSGDRWQATITETCHVSGYETSIMMMGIGSTELVEGEHGFFDIVPNGGDSPFSLTLESGTVPTGMSFNDGTVSGIPSQEGSFDFTVSATNGYGHSVSQAFTLMVAGPNTGGPTIASISPRAGPAEGGTSVVITGMNFTGATEVNFGGEPVFSFVVNSATQITASTAPHAQGTVDVEVVTPSGGATAPGAFTFDAPVELLLSINDVTVVEGDSGTTTATFEIRLNQPLPQFRSVTFDIATADGTAIAGVDYEAGSGTGIDMGVGNAVRTFAVRVNGDTLAEPDKTFFVNVTNVVGATVVKAQGVGTIQDDDAAGPTITGISPNAGAYPTIVTITGTGLTGPSMVLFGGVVSASVTGVDDNTVLAEAPPHPGGVVDVEVYTDAGLAFAPAAFTFDNSPPTANPVSATVAYGSSGNPITLDITGVPASSVAVGTAPTNGTATASGTTITYTPNTGYAGPDSFTYTATNAGGTSSPATVTITVVDPPLQDFAFTTEFETPLNLSVVNDGVPHYFLVVAPTHGTIVLNADGSATYTPNAGFSGTDEFQYDTGIYGDNTGTVTITVNQPTITYTPTNPPAGIVGAPYSQSIAGGASGGTPPHTFAHDSGTMVPGLTLAADGTLSGTPTMAGTFTFSVVAIDSSTGTGPFSSAPADVSVTIGQDAPTITDVSPNTGPMAGSRMVTITGTNLNGASAISFGGVAAANYTVESATQITAMTPAGSAGAADVVVTTPGGSATLADGFTYEAPVAAPTVSSVAVPANGYYRAGDILSFTVDFSDNVIVDTTGGTPRIGLTVGTATRYADYASGSDSRALVFQHVVHTGDQDIDGIAITAIDANGGAVASAAGGTQANLTLNNVGSTSGVLVDAVAPTVISSAVSSSPASDATTVGFDVTFSEQVNGVDPSDFVLTTTDSATGTVGGIGTADGVTYHINVSYISGTGSLRLDVLADGSITDLAGNPMTAPFASGTPWVRGGSTDAALVGLAPSAGILDPVFDPATADYDVAVDNATDSITLTPMAADANATITVAGQAVASGSASQAIALAVGTTTVSVVVTAEDNTTTRTYTVTVTRAASTNATLTSLVPSAGTLDPAFDPATLAYAVAVDIATDSIALTPTAAEVNATITVAGQAVASGSASQQIALTVGTTAIPVVVAAEDGTTTQTYTVTVTRTASTNATLVELTPSAGALDPAFDSDALDYAVAVANAVDSLTLTPIADDANATIVVDGQTVASGSASQAIALSVGPTAIQVVVTAEDDMTTRTYAVTVERAQPVPTVVSRAIEINAGETVSVDLTEGASGSPFTNAAIVDLSNAEAGTARIERDGQSYRLVFASSSTYTGGTDIRFTLSNATGTSAPGTIAFTILGRPDPSQDPEVIGLLTAQVDAAKRFAQVQTRNFNDRLEQLHNEGDRRSNSMNLRLGYNAKEKPGDREIRELVERAHETPGLLGYAPQNASGSGSGALASDEEAPSTSSIGNDGMDLGPYAIWTGGYINFGESNSGRLDLDHTMVGVSAGVDHRFSQKFIAGFGVGFGRDRTDVGANGTQSTGHAYSAAVYGSYKPFDNFFLDGLVGGSWLDFDSRRYVTATGDFATGKRSGHQVFGSLTAAYEFRDETWLVSPYGRIELSRTWLEGFAEDGGGGFGLRYGDQSIDTVSGVIGLRAEYAFKTNWGSLTPGARVEYTHDFAGSSRINLGYIDLDHLPYRLDIEASNRSYMTLGLSLEAQLPQDWTLGFDYRTAFGSNQRDDTFGLEIAKRF